MARRKGSKNRATLEHDLVLAGAKGDLSKLSYDELAAKAEKVPKPKPMPSAKPPEERGIIDPATAKDIVDDTRRRFNLMVEYYTTDEDTGLKGEDALIPERIQEFLRLNVFMAGSVDEAREVARRALAKLHIHLLVLWTNKRITGPSTPQNIAKRAAKAEKWALRLEKLGRVEEARRTRAKVAEIRRTVATTSGSTWAT